jgi:hypothetical protein
MCAAQIMSMRLSALHCYRRGPEHIAHRAPRTGRETLCPRHTLHRLTPRRAGVVAGSGTLAGWVRQGVRRPACRRAALDEARMRPASEEIPPPPSIAGVVKSPRDMRRRHGPPREGSPRPGPHALPRRGHTCADSSHGCRPLPAHAPARAMPADAPAGARHGAGHTRGVRQFWGGSRCGVRPASGVHDGRRLTLQVVRDLHVSSPEAPL